MNMYVNSWKYLFQTSFPHVPFCLPSPLDHLETSPPCLHGFAEPISIVRDHLFKHIYGTYDWKLSWTSLRLNRDNTDSGSLFENLIAAVKFRDALCRSVCASLSRSGHPWLLAAEPTSKTSLHVNLPLHHFFHKQFVQWLLLNIDPSLCFGLSCHISPCQPSPNAAPCSTISRSSLTARTIACKSR